MTIEGKRKLANAGDITALDYLGYCYYCGTDGDNKDEKEAVRLFKLAADQGYANAQSNLGLCYQHGTGVNKDEKEAVRLYKLAADQGYAQAISNLKTLGMYHTKVIS